MTKTYMSILSGFFKTKKYRKTDSGYKLQSEWTSSQTVEMNDGNTAEENLGSIKGITSSTATNNANYALSASAGKSLQDQVSELNSKKVDTTDKRLSDPRTPTAHTHDDRYYTEAEVNSLLSTKQNSSTAITASNIGSQNVNYASSSNYANSAGIAGNVSGVVSVANGGTGASSGAGAMQNLAPYHFPVPIYIYTMGSSGYSGGSGYSTLEELASALGLASSSNVTFASLTVSSFIRSVFIMPTLGSDGFVNFVNPQNTAYAPIRVSSVYQMSSKKAKEHLLLLLSCK